MTGARLGSYRLGDRSELLVEHLLTSVAFTTRVPRQEDVGIDFVCILITNHDANNLLWAGPTFTVQAKSAAKPIVYEKAHELAWIRNQENPLLVCVGNRDSLSMDIYSTWNLVPAVLAGWRGQKEPIRMVLRPGESCDEWPGLINNDDGSQEILLGKPIAHVTSEDIFNDGRVEALVHTIEPWIAIDRLNIVNRHAGLDFVIGPQTYETNRPLGPERAVSFYWHPKNLPKATNNFGLSATALWRVLHHDQIASATDVTKPP